MSFKSADPFEDLNLPVGPLTMASLLQLEPAPLRLLLKAGLRRGATTDQVAQILLQGWGWTIDSQEARSLLRDLEERGWFRPEGAIWKTRFV